MENTKAKWRRIDLTSSDHVFDDLLGIDQSGQEASAESERRCAHHVLEGQGDPDRG